MMIGSVRAYRKRQSMAIDKRTKVMMDSDKARNRAEEAFKRNEDAHVEGRKAMEEYRADERAMREKTARLRALRLAREQATKQTKP